MYELKKTFQEKINSIKSVYEFFFPRGKKGFELTMQVIVVVIILLVLLVFLLVFFTGQGGKLTGLWDRLVESGINETQQATTP